MSEYDRIDVLYQGSEVMKDRPSLRVYLEIDDLDDPDKDKKLLDGFLGVGNRVTTPKLIGVFLWISGENRRRKREAQKTIQAISDVVGQIETHLPSGDKEDEGG